MSQYPNQGGNYPQQPNQPPPPQYQGQPGGYPPRPPQYQGQPGGYPPQGQYPGQQPYGYSAAPAPVKPPPNPFLYLIPIVGIVIMAIGVFLPWFTISFLGITLSVDGLGKASGTGEVVNSYNQAGSGGAKDGVYLLGMGGLMLILSLLGLFLKARGFAIAVIVFGVFSVGLTAYDVIDINRSLNGSGSSSGASGSVGIGLYLSLIGAIVILVGAIITVAFFRKKRA